MTHGESRTRSWSRVRAAVVVAAVFAVALLPFVAGGQAAEAGAEAGAQASKQVAPLGIAAGGTLPYASPSARDAFLAATRDLGATWIRFDMTWNDIQRSNTASYDFARYDTVVADAARYGLRSMPVIAWAPRWAQDPSCAGSNVCKPRDAEEYGRFAGAMAEHFASRGVHDWEIWNEPNQNFWFAPAPDPRLYTAMLKSAYKHIHAADSRARVITGGMAPAATEGGTISPIDFLTRIYAAGGGGSFDVLGSHPYCFAGTFDCPNQTEVWSAWSQMNDTKVSLRSVMAAHGDAGKDIWATEFGAPTNGSKAVTEAHQASMLVDSFTLFGAESWSGPIFVHNLRDLGTNVNDREHWFGLLRADGSHKPAYDSLRKLMDSSPQKDVGPGPAPVADRPTVPAASAPASSVAPDATASLVPPVSTTAAPVATPAPGATTPRALPKPKKPKNWFSRIVDRIFG